jgi:hypothetical protein
MDKKTVEKPNRKKLAEEAIKRWLQDEGFTVLGTTLEIKNIEPVPNEKYGNVLTVFFDGSQEA